MAKRKQPVDWKSAPNASRKAKMRNLTLSDQTWEDLTYMAEAIGCSRSLVVTTLVAAKASVQKSEQSKR